MLYEPRESINPRTFALRHALLEELKLRQRHLAAGAAREPLVALARALDVMYDVATRHFVVTGGRGREIRISLNDFQCYDARVDAKAATWEREDAVLRANRALAARVIDQLLAPPATGATS
jgi:hypothetical protein